MSEFDKDNNLNDMTDPDAENQRTASEHTAESAEPYEAEASAEEHIEAAPGQAFAPREPYPVSQNCSEPQSQNSGAYEAGPGVPSPQNQSFGQEQNVYQQQPYGNPYRQQNQQGWQQPYNHQPYNPQSQGYYQPNTNEYIYSPQPNKKKSNIGKALIISITCLLSAVVIAIGIYSAITFDDRYDLDHFGSNIFAGEDGNAPGYRDEIRIDDNAQDPEEEIVDDDRPAANVNSTHTAQKVREYPSIIQLATPDDAMALPDIYDKVIQSVVGVSCNVSGGTQTGTGFVIDADEGYIVTNAHVIEDYISVMIVDQDLNEYEAEVIGFDNQTDIAVLRIDTDGRDLVAVEFGISGELRIGEVAIAIGNPLGFELYGTMSPGIISGLNRTVTISDNTMTLMQTTAAINRGNSGGPLIDAYGRVIGITSAKVDSTYGEGLGFAIPIDEALPIIQNLIEYGYVIGRPSIGISGRDINELLSLYMGLPRGILVYSVTEGSGAEAAGILPNDVIIGIEGETITNMNELNNIKNRYAVGDTITLTIYRVTPRSDTYGRNTGESFDVEVVLTESAPE